jgi:TPR repeat protein
MGLFALLAAAALSGSPTTISTIVRNPRPPSHEFDADLRKTNELGCRDGVQSFCYVLAGMLRFGIGGPADPRRAESLFETACHKGYAKACAEIKR